MSLRIIGAGLGRTGTLSLKLALEHLGLGRCYHAMELAAQLRQALPLWEHAIDGQPDWDAIFASYTATTDYPGCCFWPQLVAHFPHAKVILTVRDPDAWFDSVHATIFSGDGSVPSLFGDQGQRLSRFLRRELGERIGDRAFMTDYFRRWNQTVIERVPAQRLLVLDADTETGWERLCTFLEVAVPASPYPRVHARGASNAPARALPTEPALIETRMRAYLDRLAEEAFAAPPGQ
ncbi:MULTISPECIES: sulfotransferase [unclassified Xanthomonas]|uniref:sulfotransferase family protein n=1 Tax=unclassified Xanthomonas TaxID=2643310 RepID=UPI002B23232D|nr:MULTISPECIES: sulfotransferase [unclassified Xanthomonas]MEA9564340.1 sulfotransferase [Xanthomonas sp. WHRI 8932A]MEA9636112.1 sulfotransferase [Xanthomonas sp. WHRI 8812E]